MRAVSILTPLHEAIAELELAAGLVALAHQERDGVDEAVERLGRALAAVQGARALAAELHQVTGRPTLSVVSAADAGGHVVARPE